MQALDYLKLKRNLKENTIQYFQLGYAPQVWETFVISISESKPKEPELV
ncbi:hypothetical protein [Planktothrix agardhii]|nr:MULTISPECIES: hypothetical protein [Planktothrix]